RAVGAGPHLGDDAAAGAAGGLVAGPGRGGGSLRRGGRGRSVGVPPLGARVMLSSGRGRRLAASRASWWPEASRAAAPRGSAQALGPAHQRRRAAAPEAGSASPWSRRPPSAGSTLGVIASHEAPIGSEGVHAARPPPSRPYALRSLLRPGGSPRTPRMLWGQCRSEGRRSGQ